MLSQNGPVYLIVGIGFSAVLNHSLLRYTEQGKKRLGSLPVLHIGCPDPWRSYGVKQMGQWPSLLGIPTFADRHEACAAEEFLDVDRFAAATQNELLRLQNEFLMDSTVIGNVRDISDSSNHFQVEYMDLNNKKAVVLAEKVDVCTGPGRPMRLDRKRILDDNLRKKYFGAQWEGGRRKIATGEEFLNKTMKIVDKAKICIYGGSGTGAWCVERALLQPSTESVLWVSRDLSESAFPPSGRNDGLLGSKPVRDGWRLRPNQRVTPNDPKLRLAFGYEVENIGRKGSRQVEICFKEYPKGSPRYHVNYQGQECEPLTCEAFDQTVIAIGQTVGTMPDFLDSISRSRKIEWCAINRRSDIRGRKSGRNFIAGFCDDQNHEDSRIRILGSASRALPDDIFEDPKQKMEQYEISLPRQAHKSQIPSGALAIAWANGMFGLGKPNRNLNVADIQDLLQCGVETEIAELFIKNRKETIEPLIQIPAHLSSLDIHCSY